jgi:hypothetical protein
VALKSENLPMGWKEAINTYPSSIVYEIHAKLPVTRGSTPRICYKTDVVKLVLTWSFGVS